MFHHILVPTDLTDRTAGIIDTLKGLLGDRSVSVTLLHVIEQIPETDLEEFREFYSGLEERSSAKLASLALRFGEDITVAQEVVYGHPAAAIVEFAEVNGVDLIAVASHAVDRTRPGRAWGTLSYTIGMLAACPVLLVK